MIHNTQDNAGEGYAVFGGCCIAVLALLAVPVFLIGIVMLLSFLF
jgi:hypothetical protein